MSWLFKEPINNGLAQFGHAQSNSEKWPKGIKDQIAPNEFCSWKKTIKIFLYLLAPFTLETFFKKSFLNSCPKEIFFWKIITVVLIYLLAPVIVQN